MTANTTDGDSNQRRHELLKDQVRLIKKKDSDRYEVAPIPDKLSFEKGFFAVVRACQLLTQKNEGLVLIGVAGPSGAGKTVFTEKMLIFMPSIGVISMDNYNDASRIIDGNFDDPRLTDYDTLLQNIHDLKAGKQVVIPIYDFKSNSRTGSRTLEVPSSRIVIIEGIYALSEKLRPLLDLRISVTGGVHFDLVKRVLRDIQRAGQEPEEIIHQISETVYPMYKAFIEPDLLTAHIKIINKFDPFTGFQRPTYILKSTRDVTAEQIKSVMSEAHEESTEQTYDIYLLPPGEDPETCQSYLRMRNKDGKYNLMFEEWVTDAPFLISPRITFEVSVRLLGGLMALGYTIAATLKRSSHVFSDERVSVKIDWLEQLYRHYVQVQGRDCLLIKSVAEQLGLEGSYVPRTYIEQIQLEKLFNEVMALPDDLATKLSLDEDLVSSPKEALSRASEMASTRAGNLKRGMSHSYSTQRDKSLSKFSRRFEERTTDSSAALMNEGAVAQLSAQISTLNDRMDRLSSLPMEIADIILDALPLKDAWRTSVLSKAWRKKWAARPNILLDKEEIVPEEDLVKVLTKLLLQSTESIVKFRIKFGSISPVTFYPFMDDVLMFLSRCGLREIGIENTNIEPYTLPSYIFLMPNILKLTFRNCIFKPPKLFNGFNQIKCLTLHRTSLVTYTPFSLLRTPHLESLILSRCVGVPSFNIIAPNLCILYLCHNQGVTLKNFLNSKSIDTAILALSEDHTMDFTKVFKGWPVLSWLCIDGATIRALARHCNLYKLLMNSSIVKHLGLRRLRLGDMHQVVGVVCLVKSSPLLRILEISVDSKDNDETDSVWNYLTETITTFGVLENLENVTFQNFNATHAEMLLLKLILASSPRLKSVAVQEPPTFSLDQKIRVSRQLSGYRASEEAVIMVEKHVRIRIYNFLSRED